MKQPFSRHISKLTQVRDRVTYSESLKGNKLEIKPKHQKILQKAVNHLNRSIIRLTQIK